VTIPALARSAGMETHQKRRVLSILAVGGVAGAALATGVVGGSGGLGDPDEAAASALEPFDSCDELLEYAREHRWAYNAYPYAMEGDVAFLSSAGAAEDQAVRDAVPEADTANALGPSETGTNTQEVGIDEPDIAKLSGTTLFRVQGKALRSYDVSGDSAELLDEIELEGGSNTQLLIAGDKALVTWDDYDNARDTQMAIVAEVDISDPAAMSVLRRLELEGANVNARLQGSTARLAIQSQPQYAGLNKGSPQPEPMPIEDAEAPTGATGETGPEPEGDVEPDWLPQASLFDPKTGERVTTPITGCDDVSYPDEFSGLGLLSVLTIDMESGIAPTDVDSVLTDGTTVYASDDSLYVATLTMTPPNGGVVNSVGRLIAPDSPVMPVQPSGETAIHRFDTASTGETDYAASGEVPGRLIGQFAMSEEEGVLRVASTRGDTWTEGPGESESLITTLAESDGELSELGQVDGLGRGEEIYAVRFIGDMGYVVTFEQTDPLYTVDLSDPENPLTTGELKIPGYSAYLHPVADGRLLGIGQAGTDTGILTGAQASLFDVADPQQPERLDALDLSNGRYSSTSTEWDHHAFLFSPEHSMAVVPVQSYGRGGLRGAIVMSVDPDSGLTEVAQLEDEGQIERTLIAGDNLVTVSTRGVALHPIDEL
jgi:uncharacterized secreted protein with C-terminal beta-propeller domain